MNEIAIGHLPVRKLNVIFGALAGAAVCWAASGVNPLWLPLFFTLGAATIVGFWHYGLLFAIPYLVAFDAFGWEVIGKMETIDPQRTWTVLMACQILLLFVLAAVRRRRGHRALTFANPPAFEILLLVLFIGMNVFAAVVGLVHENAKIYILSDMYKCLLIPAVYLLVQLIADSTETEFLLATAALGVLAADLAQAGERFFAAFQGSVLRLGGPSILPFVYFLYYGLHAKGSGRRRISLALFLVSAITVIATNSIRAFVEAAVALFLVLLIERKDRVKSLLRVASAFLLLVVLGGLLAAWPATRGAFTTLYTDTEHKLMSETFVNGELGASEEGRIEQINVALDGTVRSGSISRAILGNGNGAQFLDWGNALRGTGYYRILQGWDAGFMDHTLHDTYCAVLFRMGIVGLALFLAFIACLLWVVGSLLLGGVRLAAGERQVLQVLFVYLLLSFALELNIHYTLFGYVQWGVVLGIVGILARKYAVPRAAGAHLRPHAVPVPNWNTPAPRGRIPLR
jgi:hypothetical protein